MIKIKFGITVPEWNKLIKALLFIIAVYHLRYKIDNIGVWGKKYLGGGKLVTEKMERGDKWNGQR